MAATKLSRNFTISKTSFNWLNILKYQEHVNLSAYVDSLILKDMEKRKSYIIGQKVDK